MKSKVKTEYRERERERERERRKKAALRNEGSNLRACCNVYSLHQRHYAMALK
jgi:hypothetical protein